MTTRPRHDFGWLPTRGLQVPLLTSGDEHVGFFRVPREAITFKEHSNQVHQYGKVVRQKVKEWAEWKAKQGWYIRGKPTVMVPVESPTERTGIEPKDGDDLRVYVKARFIRRVPLHITLDDYIGRMDQYRRYGLDIPTEFQSSNPLPATKPFLEVEGTTNPMEAAEQRRRKLGLTVEPVFKDGEYVESRVRATTPVDETDQAVTGENNG